MKTIVTLSFALLFAANIFAADDATTAQPNTLNAKVQTSADDAQYIIAGDITDSLNRETLAGATITADGQKVYSDLDGRFTLAVNKPGTYTLRVELISYETAEVKVEVKDDNRYSIELAQR